MEFVAQEDKLDEVVQYLTKLLQEKPIIAFRGELGAGKTTLIKNICNFLEVKDEVSSPTFSIVNEYQTRQSATVYHFDFYRLNDEEEAFDMGVEDYFYSGRICLLEWPSKVESILPEERVEVAITLLGNKRKYTIT